MDKKGRSGDLLQTLKQLFRRFFMLDLDRRIHTYHQTANTPRSQHITRSLNEQIDELVAVSSKQSAIPARKISDDQSQHGSQSPPQQQDRHTEGASVTTVGHDYFEKHTGHRDEDLGMGDKLRESAWSHLHSALLYARQGDAGRAKLHADIAHQALKEAAHYLSEEEFEALSNQLEQALAEHKSH
jgi:hypothetical protein